MVDLPTVVGGVLRQRGTIRLPMKGCSMVHTIPDGSEIVVVSCTRFVPGDVCLYSHDRTLIAHRLIRRSSAPDGIRYVMQGEGPGAWRHEVPECDVLGRVTEVIHGDGRRALDGLRSRILARLWVRARPLARLAGGVGLQASRWRPSR